ncbi:hypothetical protein P170DRAFT_474835 [Aspergillus steynii IBT 23096]|uniref:Polymerase nucleotidyl transferase domain-containing protein n=1 Tax=Aspergillus steynii IBT 23096 TaxID=1392250 RepID=A0A2I2GEJ4_9EURO|nr:uncharacterized protein P170DRAFT_474835 [Aspergillus steynii IBT 23096]PLB51290.1 hypothetical protein P170DRAFT_474835 [Aspergillus steynii IBT 23096]
MADYPQLHEQRRAVRRVIRHLKHIIRLQSDGRFKCHDRLKEIPSLHSLKLVAIGGFAVRSLLPVPRPTMDVDLMVDLYPTGDELPKLPNGLAQALKALLIFQYPEIYSQDGDYFRVKIQSTPALRIRVDFVLSALLPFVPRAAHHVLTIPTNHIPLSSISDLLAQKVYCCSLRPWLDKSFQDVADAERLATHLGPLVYGCQSAWLVVVKISFVFILLLVFT